MVSLALNRERKAGILRVVLALEQEPIRGLLAGLIGDRIDVDVVAQVDDPIDLLLAVKETDAHVVILSWPEGKTPPAICSHLFAEFPGLLILGISSTFRGYVSRQVVQTAAVGDIFPQRLSAVVDQLRSEALEV
jgi:hypothetical protein